MLPTNINLSFSYKIHRQKKDNWANEEEKQLFLSIDRFINEIKKALTSKKEFSISAYNLFDDALKIRILAINWIGTDPTGLNRINNSFDLIEDSINSHIAVNNKTPLKGSKIKGDSPRSSNKNKEIEISLLQNLITNTNFTIRTLRKVYKGIVNREIEFHGLPELSEMPNVTYKEIIGLMRMVSPIQKGSLDFFSSSLMAEICLISIDILFEHFKRLEVQEKRIIELNRLLVENSQLYGASALQLGIIGRKRRQLPKHEFKDQEIKEQIELAELGMNEYAKILENE